MVSVVLWASAFVGIRAAGAALSAGILSLLRLLIGSITRGALVALRRQRLPPRRDYIRLAACVVLWFGLYNVTLNTAERTIDAGTAVMLVNVSPILIAVLGGLLLHKGFREGFWSVTPSCLLEPALATSSHGPTVGVGALLCLVAAAAYAAALILDKPCSPALAATCLACSVGAVCCLPFAGQLVIEAGRVQSACSPGPFTLAWRRRRSASAPGPTLSPAALPVG